MLVLRTIKSSCLKGVLRTPYKIYIINNNRNNNKKYSKFITYFLIECGLNTLLSFIYFRILYYRLHYSRLDFPSSFAFFDLCNTIRKLLSQVSSCMYAQVTKYKILISIFQVSTIVNLHKMEKFLKKAVVLAENSDLRSRHVSFLVKNKKIIAYGVNRKKTHSFAAYNGYKYPYIHSELAAIKTLRQNAYDARGSVLVNVRVSRDGKSFLLSRPCPRCLRLARRAGVRLVAFTDGRGGFSTVS